MNAPISTKDSANEWNENLFSNSRVQPILCNTERNESVMPKMKVTTPNMTSPTMSRAMYPNHTTNEMMDVLTAESNLHNVCPMLMFVVILP